MSYEFTLRIGASMFGWFDVGEDRGRSAGRGGRRWVVPLRTSERWHWFVAAMPITTAESSLVLLLPFPNFFDIVGVVGVGVVVSRSNIDGVDLMLGGIKLSPSINLGHHPRCCCFSIDTGRRTEDPRAHKTSAASPSESRLGEIAVGLGVAEGVMTRGGIAGVGTLFGRSVEGVLWSFEAGVLLPVLVVLQAERSMPNCVAISTQRLDLTSLLFSPSVRNC
mmetsp:Transcript_36602/g.59192  ORF Transcript_36602/g.59192 Transcript_36602/m.59192 type:complete len:221 (-) Transcript_36602:1227-1889(-)